MPEIDKSAQIGLRHAVSPRTPEELADALASAAAQKRTIALSGASTKHLMGGPIDPADVAISTGGLSRVLHYEPRDLTISVESGIRYA